MTDEQQQTDMTAEGGAPPADANTTAQPGDPGAQQTSTDAGAQGASSATDTAANGDGQPGAGGAAGVEAQEEDAAIEDAGSPIGEEIMQRLRYFENLVEHQFEHIKALGGALARTGTAVPSMPHFASLKSRLGNYNPHAPEESSVKR